MPSRMGSSWARYVGSSLIAVQEARARETVIGRVERETGPGCGTRLVKSTKLREGGGQVKICWRIISIGLDRPPKPRDRLLPTAEVVLRQARISHPAVSHRIARTEAQGLANVSLRFFGATDKNLTKSDIGWAKARFRSSANACSHSAMPSAARLVNMSTNPNNIWPRAWSGTEDKALVNFASAAAKRRHGISHKGTCACDRVRDRQIQTSASTLSGSAMSARSKKHARFRDIVRGPDPY